ALNGRRDPLGRGITNRWTRGAKACFATNLSDSKLSLPRARVNSTVRRLLLTMKNTPNQSRIITGVAWYRSEQWQRLREVSEDVANLEETYDAWLQTAERMIRDGIPADVVVEKIDVDVEEVLAWCNVMDFP